MNSSADRSLLFGILAWQNGFIATEPLLTAIRVWLEDKSKPLGEVLVQQGDLSAQQRALLEQLIDARVQQDGGDAGQSLANLSSSLPFADELAAMHDDALAVSLSKLPPAVYRVWPGDDSESHSSRESGQSHESATSDDWLHPIYDRFEAAWREHVNAVKKSEPTTNAQLPAPRLEDFLNEVPDKQQKIALRELLIIELHWRRKNGETPEHKSYQRRFPDWPHIVDDAFKLANGRYQVPDKSFDKGGIGEVFLARDLELNRNVAFKTVQPKQDNDVSRKRLVIEGEITGGLEHPGIVPVYGLGHFRDGRPFYAMRFIKGENLQKAIQRFHGTLRENDPLAATILGQDSEARDDVTATGSPSPTATHTKVSVFETKRLEFRELLGRFVDVCQAVAYAHSRKVLHRDLKPGNIMLGKYGETLVVDWGLAKTLGRLEEATPFDPQFGTDAPLIPSSGSDQQLSIGFRPGRVALGTLQYMSPEQANGRLAELGPATDIFSLGATLFELLTGQAPIGATPLAVPSADGPPYQPDAVARDAAQRKPTLEELAQQAIFPKPRQLLPRIPAPLEAICLKAMSHDERDRYPTAQALAKDIERWLAEASEEAARVRRLLYIAHMNLAQMAWENNQVARVLELLESQRPAEDREDLRGFEWFYWDRKCHSDLHTFPGHSNRVTSVAFSTDGKRLASASWDGTMKVWDTMSGQEMLTLKGYTGSLFTPVASMAFSADGKRLASAGGYENLTVKVWDATNGQETLTLKGHTSEVNSVAFSLDGKRLASGSDDQTVKVWDTTSGQEMLTLKGHTDAIMCVAFSADGKLLASAAGIRATPPTAGEIKVWDAMSGQEMHTLSGHTGGVGCVAFSPVGNRIASASDDQTVKVWDATSGQETLTLKGHTDWVTSVAFSADGRRLASASFDTTVKVWDASNGQETLTLKGHAGEVTSVAFNADGRRLASASEDQTVKMWDATSGQETLTLEGHSGDVWSVAISADGKRLASASKDQTVKVWDATSGQEMLTLKGHSGNVWSVAISADGKWMATASEDQTVKVWDVTSGHEMLMLKGHTDGVTSVVFSADGKRIASGSNDETVRVWDAMSGQEIVTLNGHAYGVTSVAFSADGKHLASATGDQSVKVWDATSGQETLTLKGHTGWVRSVAFSADGKRLASASEDQTVKVWDAMSGQETLTLKGHAHWVYGVTFSPDGRRLVSASRDGTAKVWDATSGQEMLTLKGHTDGVASVAFSSDGRRLASASWDKTVKVWDAWPWTPELRAEREALSLIHFLRYQGQPQSEWLAAISSDQTLSDPVRQRALQFVRGWK